MTMCAVASSSVGMKVVKKRRQNILSSPTGLFLLGARFPALPCWATNRFVLRTGEEVSGVRYRKVSGT
jgi:hypothetical protein